MARRIEFYRLEMIVAVGYPVKSARGTQFRQWATTQLREYLVKGFAMNDERLKQDGGGDWASLYATISRPFDRPKTGKIAVKVINHYGDEVLKVFPIQ